MRLLVPALMVIDAVFCFGQQRDLQKNDSTNDHQVQFESSARYELGFSPGGTAFAVVMESIANAQRTIHIACYEFTSGELADSLVRAAERGVVVQIVADGRASAERSSQIPFLAAKGIAVRRDLRYAILHDKFMVIDDDSVETGSFNYTVSADGNNAENALLILHDSRVASAFAAEWRRLWNESDEVH